MAVPPALLSLLEKAFVFLIPLVLTYVKDHPEIWTTVQDALKKVVVRPTAGPKELAKTIAGLREQVAYLRDSADDESETRRAAAWSQRLDRLDRVAALLGDGASRNEVQTLRKQVLAIRTEILEAFVIEQAEDAEARRRLD